MESPKTHFLTREIWLDHPRLVILGGPKKGEEIELRDIAGGMRVGSDPANELVFEDLAPLHAELSV